MKCRECPDYAKCAKESNLKIKRKSCKKAKTEYVMTNADRIRAMRDEELANVLREFATKPMQGSFLKWLQQPAEEDDYG